MLRLHFIIPQDCPRLRYVCKQLFELPYGIPCSFEVDSYLGPCQYKVVDSQGNVVLDAEAKLFFSQNFVSAEAWDWEGLKQNRLNGDWLGAIFFLLSRMEEYGSAKDAHGRFSAVHSTALIHGFLHRPLVDELLQHFLTSSLGLASNLPTKVIPTLDIDMTHAIKGRGVLRQTALLFRSLGKRNLGRRLRVLMGKENDPFDNFAYQQTVFSQYQVQAQYFFQVGDYGKFDKNIAVNTKAFQQVLKSIDKKHGIGLHPSYRTMEKPSLIVKEKKRLETTLHYEIKSTRFHFLRFALPESYQLLLDHNIMQEYSMGYSDYVGFRASTSRPFFWFDLQKNTETLLHIVPFCVMDVALQHFMKLSPEEAIAHIKAIKETIAKVGGVFSFCFHNESLSEEQQWKDWRKVFEAACQPILRKEEKK